MPQFPIVFTLNTLVAGNGFFARIVSKGRALVSHDDEGGYWVDGVTPPAIADGSAEGQSEALHAFRNRYTLVLFDIAHEADDFENFDKRVREFFYAEDTRASMAWSKLREEVRAGRVLVDELPKVHDEFPPEVRVSRIEPMPSQNTLETPKPYEFAEAA